MSKILTPIIIILILMAIVIWVKKAQKYISPADKTSPTELTDPRMMKGPPGPPPPIKTQEMKQE